MVARLGSDTDCLRGGVEDLRKRGVRRSVDGRSEFRVFRLAEREVDAVQVDVLAPSGALALRLRPFAAVRDGGPDRPCPDGDEDHDCSGLQSEAWS